MASEKCPIQVGSLIFLAVGGTANAKDGVLQNSYRNPVSQLVEMLVGHLDCGRAECRFVSHNKSLSEVMINLSEAGQRERQHEGTRWTGGPQLLQGKL